MAKAPYKGAIGYGQGQPAREASIARKGGACGQKRRSRAQPLSTQCSQGGPMVGRPQGTVARGQPCRQQGQQRRPQGCPPLGKAGTGE
ncbi:hypothetical protein GW17_00053750 [Ensete ventricosum]|nr:hypothetical protein GW17_00053750 [Ensete ventricosum]RZS14959.1 hypothetical protein BHM03_00046724 [Ensete ventricosum]